jgi:uncharacterized DUF497 family protein
VRFEWDDNKDLVNKKKHGLSFDTARQVFLDPWLVRLPERVVNGEMRYWTVGKANGLTIVIVVHTLRNDFEEEVCRIISARKATPSERRIYEKTD